MTNVKDGCEKIQHFGASKDETGTTDEPDKEVSLKKITDTLADVKKAYFKVERFLRRYYGETVDEEEEKEEEKETPSEKKEEKKDAKPEKEERKDSSKGKEETKK